MLFGKTQRGKLQRKTLKICVDLYGYVIAPGE